MHDTADTFTVVSTHTHSRPCSTLLQATNQKERGMTEKDVKRLEAALEEEQEMADDPEALLDSIEVGGLDLWRMEHPAHRLTGMHSCSGRFAKWLLQELLL